jgi:putative peptidoglycan lipid II flippase
MIFKNSLVLAFFSALSLLFAIVRDRLLATTVGVGATLDLYNASFRIPDLVYGSMLAFVTSATVVPFLTKEHKDGTMQDPLHRLTSLTSLFLLVIITLSFVVGCTLPFFAHYIVPGFSHNQIEEYVFLTRLLLVQPLFLGLASLFSCYAQFRNQFILYGISPLLYSLGIIFGVVSLYPLYGAQGLIIGVVLGAGISMIVQAFSLRDIRIHHMKSLFSFSLLKEAIRLALPRTGTNLITQVRTILFHGFATTLGPGYLSAYLFGLRVTDAVVQVIQQSVTTASIPVLSKQYAEKKTELFQKTVKKYTVTLLVIGVLTALFLYFMRNETVHLLYGKGEMNHLIVYFLVGALIALPFQMVSGYFSISLYSLRDTKSVMIAYLFASLLAVASLHLVGGRTAMSLFFANTFFWISLSMFLTYMYSKKNR